MGILGYPIFPNGTFPDWPFDITLSRSEPSPSPSSFSESSPESKTKVGKG